jgi:hypothetical protein
LRVDLQLASTTVKAYVAYAREFISFLGGKRPTAGLVRAYLRGFIDGPRSTYANRLKRTAPLSARLASVSTRSSS